MSNTVDEQESEWPTLEEIGVMALLAREEGFSLLLLQLETGFGWVWRHEPSGMEFDGECDAHTYPVAFVCALNAIPKIIVRPKQQVDTE